MNRAASYTTQITQRGRTVTCTTGIMPKGCRFTLRPGVFALDCLPLKELL